MKQLFLFILFFIIFKAYSQTSTDQFVALPDNTISFVDSPNVSWASFGCKSYSFLNCNIDSFKNIYDYLIKAKDEGKIKSYDFNDIISLKRENDIFFEVDRNYCDLSDLIKNREFKEKSLTYDTLKRLKLDQIFYIKNHKLRSYIRSVAPIYNSKLLDHNPDDGTIKSWCSLNKIPDYFSEKTDDVILLKTTYYKFNIDSFSFGSIKTTYGMKPAFLLWYDLANGYNKAIDLKTNKEVSENTALGYDSIHVQQYDSIGTLIGIKIVPIFNPPMFTAIGIYQNWYYNVTKNIFTCEIMQADLYVRKDYTTWDDEKRFKIIFK